MTAKSGYNLPDAELDVLACLWKRRNLTVREIRGAMQDYRPMTHAAASTLLKRLQGKGLVKRKKGSVGKAYVFRATVPPTGTYRRVVSDLVKRVFAGNGLAMVSALYETQPPTPEELDQLQELIDNLRSKRGGRHRP